MCEACYKHVHIYHIHLVDNMKFNKQHHQLVVQNLDKLLYKEDGKLRRHGKLLPNSIRALVVGPSNCGKTNAMLSLLLDPNGLIFSNIYLYSKSLQQPKYEFLKELISPMKEISFHAFSNNCDVIDPNEAKHNSVFIFDDIACEKQNNVRSYFCMGRHNDVDSFYLCQTYTRIPKHLIRDNANFLIIFKQDDMNLKHIYNDHVNADMSFENFRDVCGACWKDDYGFIVVDKDSTFHNGRYRKGFDTFIKL